MTCPHKQNGSCTIACHMAPADAIPCAADAEVACLSKHPVVTIDSPGTVAFSLASGWMRKNHPERYDEWNMKWGKHRERLPAKVTPKVVRISSGPGTELKAIFKRMNIPGCEACNTLAERMDAWGVDGCRERTDEIVAEMLPRAKHWIEQNRPWMAWATHNRLADAAISLKIRGWVTEAVDAAEAKRIPARDVSGDRRHLIYHIFPVSGNGIWQWNVGQLRQRLHLFDGTIAVAVVTPEKGCKYKLDSIETVRDAFDGVNVDHWIVAQNNPKLRETVTWQSLLESVVPQDGITFSAHAKGVTADNRDSHARNVRRWTEAMYRLNLDRTDSVHEALRTHAMAGAFRRYGEFKKPKGGNLWHYSGTFYWFRNECVRGRDWRRVENYWWWTEAAPGFWFTPNETACLFGDNAGDMYMDATWAGLERQLCTA